MICSSTAPEGYSLTTLGNDCCDNTASCHNAPVFTTCPSDIIVNAGQGQCGTQVFYNVVVENTMNTAGAYPSGYVFPVGTTHVTISASNSCGDAVCSFTVTVVDNEAPVITHCPSNISVNQTPGLCTKAVSWTVPTAADNCLLQSFTSNYSSGYSFPIGTTTVTYTAIDNHGNTSTCSFTITVNRVAEICGNGIDDNCNGQIDENCTQTCTMTATASSTNPVIFYGYSADQTSPVSVSVSGGTAPYTYSWSMSRGLLCNMVNSAGDEYLSGGWNVSCGCTTTACSTPAGSYSGSSFSATLTDDADFSVAVTDANHCTATSTVHIDALDARCFAGNSNNGKVTVCHHAGNQWVQICVDQNAVAALVAQGDLVGTCHANGHRPVAGTQSFSDFAVYPNPATDKLKVTFNSFEEKSIIEMFNEVGKLVFSKSLVADADSNYEESVDVRALANGIYMVRVSNQSDVMLQKFVKV
jgi:hypothetical protein